jgi:hypothetical protein
MSTIKKRTVWARFPEFVRRMRQAVYLKHGIREERYPIEMRRVLYLAYLRR